MKQICGTYIKTYTCDWRTAHLYEHIVLRHFRRELSNSFGKTELFGVVNARTYEQSFIEISYCFYFPEPVRKLYELLEEPLELGDNKVEDAIKEIESEEGIAYDYNLVNLKKELSLIHKNNWHSLAEFTYKDFGALEEANTFSTNFYPLRKIERNYAELKLVAPSKMKFSPIVPFVSDLVLGAIVAKCYDSLLMHSKDKILAYRDETCVGSQTVLMTQNTTINKSEISKLAKEKIEQFRLPEEVQKLSKYLQGLYELNMLDGNFVLDEVFDNTRLLVGLSGIKDLATPDNLITVLDTLECQIKLN